MNITDLESSIQVDAKICGSVERRKIAYSIVDFHHSLYINKKDIILAQISACELLYKYTSETFDKNVLKKEISDLKLMLDLIE
jgi:hypothetical protein